MSLVHPHIKIVSPGSLYGEPEGKKYKCLTSGEVRANREYFKEATFNGLTIREGDKVVWDWHIKEGEERKPKKIKAIFKERNILFYPTIKEITEETIWLDFGDAFWQTFRTRDGRWAIVKAPTNFDSEFLHKLNFRIVS